jgi:hypothetical protein
MRVHFPFEMIRASGKQSGMRRRGWLLLLAGLAFLAAVVFFAAPLIMAFDERGLGKRMARLDIAAIRDGIQLYKERTGHLPATLSELVPLELREVHRDRWGREYRYTSDGGAAEIRSAGPNGKYGDADDIFQDVTSGRIR